MKGMKIKVVVTDTAGKTFESAESSPVTEDNTDRVTITDASAFQSDGTALVGDSLKLTYGAGLGIPKSITWYLNDKVVQAYTSESGSLNTALTYTTTKVGNVYAVIVNAEGTSFTSDNVVTVVDTQLAVSISDFQIINDYDTPTLSVAKNDANAIGVVTISKDVRGKFYVFKEGVDYKTDNKIEEVDLYSNAINADYRANFTTKYLEATGAAANGIFYTEEDGTTYYMWDMTGTPTRGTKYVIAFDQERIDTDNIGSTANANANMISEGVEAPYLVAPTAIKLDTPTAGATSYKVTFQNGDKDYAGLTTALSTDISATTVYTKASAEATTSSAVGTVNSAVKDGVVTQDGITAAVQGAYYFVKSNVKAGFFGTEAFELTSEDVLCGKPVTKNVKITQNKTTSTSADVEFDALADAATVYITKDPTKLSATDTSTFSASKEVEKGTTKVTVENAFTEAGSWYAVVIPADDKTFSKVASVTAFTYATGKAENISFATMTGVTNASEGITLSNKLVATDAWGATAALTPVTAGADTIHPVDETCSMFNKDTNVAGTAKPEIGVKADGTIDFKVKAAALKDEAYCVLLDTGELVVHCTSAGSPDSSVWEISYSTDGLAVLATDNDNTTSNLAPFKKLDTSGWTVISPVTATLPATVDKIASGATLKIVDDVLTVNHTLENAGTIVVDAATAATDGIGGTGTIKNSGTFRIAAGINTGAKTIENTGTLYVAAGSDIAKSGAVAIKNNGTFTFNGLATGALTFTGTEGTYNLGSTANTGTDQIAVFTAVLANADTAVSNKINLNENVTQDDATATVKVGTILTIAKGKTLTTDDDNAFTNLGTIVNNGEIALGGTAGMLVNGAATTAGHAALITNNGEITINTDETDIVNHGVINDLGTATTLTSFTAMDGSAYYSQRTSTTATTMTLDAGSGAKVKVGYSADKFATFTEGATTKADWTYSSSVAPTAKPNDSTVSPAYTNNDVSAAAIAVAYASGSWTLTVS